MYKAIYNRYGTTYSEELPSHVECKEYLEYGSEAGEFMDIAIVDSDYTILWYNDFLKYHEVVNIVQDYEKNQTKD